jgi:hypothetical protein
MSGMRRVAADRSFSFSASASKRQSRGVARPSGMGSCAKRDRRRHRDRQATTSEVCVDSYGSKVSVSVDESSALVLSRWPRAPS